MRSDPQLPYYDDLAETLAESWRLLGRGVADRRHGFHHPVIATIGLDGAPQARTVILRGVDPAQREIIFHTDMRSGKIEELTRNPAISAHFYDEKLKIQLRLQGGATIHAGDELAKTRWRASQPMSRVCYSIAPGPGRPLEKGGAFALSDVDRNPAESDASSGPEPHFLNFGVVQIGVYSLEWLFLAVEGHRRARFHWDEMGELKQTWLAP